MAKTITDSNNVKKITTYKLQEMEANTLRKIFQAIYREDQIYSPERATGTEGANTDTREDKAKEKYINIYCKRKKNLRHMLTL